MKKALIFCLVLLFVFLDISPVFAAFEYYADMRLTVPAYGYEGHSFQVYDASIYNLGSTEGSTSNQTVYSAASSGYVTTTWSGNFTILSAMDGNGIYVKPFIRFANPGTYTASLSSRWLKGPKRGERNNISKDIVIRPCPFFDSFSLEGEKRSCRKLTLKFSLAQNPLYPITDITVDIPGAYTGELTYQTDEKNEFVNGSIDFIVKTDSKKECTAIFTAKDSRGKEVSDSYSFTILPDLYPYAFINSNDTFYRTTSGYAVVAADALRKESDDKQIYSWELKDKDGNTYNGSDESLGLNMAMEYRLPKVGRYNLKLTISDLWDSSTLGDLEKYITPDDFKTSTYEKTITVNNLAPSVNLEGSSVQNETKNVKLLLLNYQGDVNQLIQNLADQNIAAEIKEGSAPDKSEEPGKLIELGSFKSPYSTKLTQNGDASHFWENACYTDGENIYRLTCALNDNVPIAPFTRRTYKISDLESTDDISNLFTEVEITSPDSATEGHVSENEILQADGGYPVYDSNGNVNYTFTMAVGKSKATTVTLKRLSDSKTIQFTIEKNYARRIGFALEMGDGSLMFAFGGDKFLNSTGRSLTINSTYKVVSIKNFDPSTMTTETGIDEFFFGYKKDDIILLTYAYAANSTTTIYRFTKGYDNVVNSLKEGFFTGEGNEIILDAKTDMISADAISAMLGGNSSSSSSASGSSFSFVYSDPEGDPFLKAKYIYNGQTIETDSLTITIQKVQGANELLFYVMDNTGDSEFNKWSKACRVILDSSGGGSEDPTGPNSPGSGGGSGSGSGSGGTIENPPISKRDEFISIHKCPYRVF